MCNVKTIILMSLFPLMFLVFSCTSPIYEESFSIDKRITEKQRKDAINNTVLEFDWTASFPKKGIYRIHVKKKTHKAVFDIVCKKSTCVTHYVSSENLKYNAAKRTIHGNYNKWVKTFITKLTARLEQYNK